MKTELKTLREELEVVAKNEAEDTLKGMLKVLAKVPAMLVSKYSWMAYVLPFVPMIVGTLEDLIDKIDGEED